MEHNTLCIDLTEGEENLKPKVESILEACNALCSSQMHVGTSLCSKGGQTQKITRKRLMEAVLKLQSSCQASHMMLGWHSISFSIRVIIEGTLSTFSAFNF